MQKEQKQELKQNNYESIAKEEFERVLDLFAEILFKGVSMQLKQGLYRNYEEKHESLPMLKGHIDINNTIRNKIQRKNILACDYDELSEIALERSVIEEMLISAGFSIEAVYDFDTFNPPLEKSEKLVFVARKT